jgi:hypothetical protein
MHKNNQENKQISRNLLEGINNVLSIGASKITTNFGKILWRSFNNYFEINTLNEKLLYALSADPWHDSAIWWNPYDLFQAKDK